MGKMNFIKTTLQDAYIVELNPIKDYRGQFVRTFCMQEFEKIGHTKPFVQINHSTNIQKGTLRGMHFQQKPNREIKLIRCISGSIYDVIIDLRKDSPTFSKHFGIELSKENGKMIYVPEGFAHGFQTIEDNTELLYHHTAFYTPEVEGGVKFNDEKFMIEWPLPIVNLSDKDASYKYLNSNFQGI